MAQMTSQFKTLVCDWEIFNWQIREQEKILKLVINQSALAQAVSQSTLTRFWHTHID